MRYPPDICEDNPPVSFVLWPGYGDRAEEALVELRALALTTDPFKVLDVFGEAWSFHLDTVTGFFVTDLK